MGKSTPGPPWRGNVADTGHGGRIGGGTGGGRCLRSRRVANAGPRPA